MSESAGSVARVGKMVLPLGRKLLLLAAAGAVFLALGAVLPPEVFSTLASVVSILVMGVTIVAMLRSFRKERPLGKLTQWIAMVTPIVTLVLSVFVFGGGGNEGKRWFVMMFPAMGLGLGIGLFWSRATKLHLRDGRVYGVNRGWWIALWGFSFMVSQGLVLTRRAQAVQASLVLLALASGIAVGTAAGLLRSISRAARSGAPAGLIGPPPARPGVCSTCKEPLRPGASFCEGCGGRVS